jgi:hypothetical protein
LPAPFFFLGVLEGIGDNCSSTTNRAKVVVVVVVVIVV